MKKKIYSLDTNVLIQNPNSLFAFQDNDVVLVDVVVDELDRHKNKEGDIGFNCREVSKTLRDLRQKGSLLDGVCLPGGGTLRIVPFRKEDEVYMLEAWNKEKADNKILATTKRLMEERQIEHNTSNAVDSVYVAIVTKDTNMTLMADCIGLPAEDFRTERVAEDATKYAGRCTLYVSENVINQLFDEKSIPLMEVLKESESLNVNEFLCLVDQSNTKHSALARFDGERIVPLQHEKESPCGLIPRNVGQRFAMEALLEPAGTAPLTILKGPAGTGKTLCALAAGLEKVMEEGLYNKVIITRANVKMDADIGYLKGDMEDKMTPLMAGAFDNLQVLMDQYLLQGKPSKDFSRNIAEDKIEEILDRGYLEIECLAYLRGRSLSNCFVIVDEAQNTTPNQILSIITRCGIGSKIVLCGDPEQIDNPRLDSRTNGLVYASDKMLGSHLTWQVSFEDRECLRSSLAQEASERMKLQWA